MDVDDVLYFSEELGLYVEVCLSQKVGGKSRERREEVDCPPSCTSERLLHSIPRVLFKSHDLFVLKSISS